MVVIIKVFRSCGKRRQISLIELGPTNAHSTDMTLRKGPLSLTASHPYIHHLTMLKEVVDFKCTGLAAGMLCFKEQTSDLFERERERERERVVLYFWTKVLHGLGFFNVVF